jgi:hypothetical protein
MGGAGCAFAAFRFRGIGRQKNDHADDGRQGQGTEEVSPEPEPPMPAEPTDHKAHQGTQKKCFHDSLSISEKCAFELFVYA